MQSAVLTVQAIPKNGGEKNYLEYLVRRPKFLITCAYASNGVLLGEWSQREENEWSGGYGYY